MTTKPRRRSRPRTRCSHPRPPRLSRSAQGAAGDRERGRSDRHARHPSQASRLEPGRPATGAGAGRALRLQISVDLDRAEPEAAASGLRRRCACRVEGLDRRGRVPSADRRPRNRTRQVRVGDGRAALACRTGDWAGGDPGDRAGHQRRRHARDALYWRTSTGRNPEPGRGGGGTISSCWRSSARRTTSSRNASVGAGRRSRTRSVCDPLARQLRADRRTNSSSRMACSEPPVTLEERKVQGAQRFRAADTVGVEAVLALVGHQPAVSLQAEISVDQAGVETEILQPWLAASQRRRRTSALRTDDARCAHPGGRDASRRARLELRFADDAIDEQPAVLLKRAYRVVELVVEGTSRATCFPVLRSASALSR